MTGLDDPRTLNADQRSFWNEGPGQTWAQLQPLLDQQHAEAARILLERSQLTPGEAVLDVGCGGGATTFAAARAVGPAGRVVGLDISDPILQLARDDLAASGLDHVSFELGDAQAFETETPFDAVISRFGVMFFDDPRAGFAHLRGLLRPGGRICWIVWAGPEWNTHFRVSSEIAAEILGPAPAADPTAPGPMALRDVDRVTGLLEAAGFDAPEGEVIDGHIAMPEAAALPLLTRVGPVASRVRAEGLSDAVRDEIGARIREVFARFLSDGVYHLPARYILYTATRP